jgi:hypothetical protein
MEEALGISTLPKWRRRLNRKIDDIRLDIRYSLPVRKFRDFRYALRNMIFRGHNNVKLTKFTGKSWVETDVRLFEATFELLCDYLENQKAWIEVAFQSDKYGRLTRWKMRYLPRAWRKELSRELALRYLDWEINECDLPHQADAARKQKELYLWYNDVYNKYEDPWDKLPHPPGKLFDSTPCEWDEDGNPTMYEMNLHRDDPVWDEYHKASDDASAEETRRYNEATEKAIEVLRIRESLWT